MHIKPFIVFVFPFFLFISFVFIMYEVFFVASQRQRRQPRSWIYIRYRLLKVFPLF